MSHDVPGEGETVEAAYARGRNAGFATAAMALAVVSYVNLLGIEKSLLAITFAVIALKGAAQLSSARRRIWAALALAAIHAITVIVVVVVYADKLALLARQVIALYHSLS